MFPNKLPDNESEYNILKELENSFKQEFNLTPCLGAELEFYLPNLKSEEQLLEFQKNCNLIIKKEKGLNQYEIEIPPQTNVCSYPNIIRNMRNLIKDEAAKIGLVAIFEPKPFPGDFGSSMHIHFNFLEDTNAEKYAQILCHYLPFTLKAFLPNKEDYQRLDHKYMAPTHISYGGNNRTTLIRIPDSHPKRLEHRLAGANADPGQVIYAILWAIGQGLKYPDQIAKLEKIHGNAYEEQYGLPLIVRW
jgi:glutamine synthetase